MERGHFLDRAKKHLNDGREPKKEYKPREFSSDKSYYQNAYPESYGRELAGRIRKVNASGKFNNFYRPIYAGYYYLVPEEVLKSDISPIVKNHLIKTAAYAWEIRSEEDEKTGEVKNYFILRDDIELNSLKG